MGLGGGGSWGYRGQRRHGDFFGLDVESMSPRARTVAALAVLGPVVLSGVLLVVLAPQMWWIFTTYFWVAFPALGLLTGGDPGVDRDRPRETSGAALERELLEAVRDGGEVSAASAAARTSLSVAEADRRLKELAENGHIEVRARGGAVLYSLWGVGHSGATP